MGGNESRGSEVVVPAPAELSGLTREEKLALVRRLAAASAEGKGSNEPVQPAEATGPGRHPVSFAQRRMWFLDRLEPGGSHNTIFRALRLRGVDSRSALRGAVDRSALGGAVDRSALRGAVERLVARHEALRTRFEETDGEPVQVVERPEELPPALVEVDLRALAEGERVRRLDALARAEAARPFDLGRAPLARFTLVSLGAREAVLLIALHHIVADGWSLGILLRELSVLYSAAVRGHGAETADLPALATTYGFYARSQRRRLSGEPLERELAFWRARLKGAPTVLELPTDRPRPAMETFRGAIEPVDLGDATSAGVRELARSERATTFMVLLAAFAATLSRWAGRDDLLLGTPVAGRPESALEPLVGFFANTLVLRVDLGGRPTFRELVHRVRAHTLESFGHQETPFERLVEELEEERDLSRNPLFQVMFALQNLPATRLSLEGLELEQMAVERGLAKVDLTFDLQEAPERGGSVRGYLEYNTDLFDRSTARRLAEGFRRLVAAATSAPDREVGDLPLLSAAERHALVVEWQGASCLPPPAAGAGLREPVHEAIRRRVAADPERVAVEVGNDRWTYGSLDRAAARLADRLGALGIGAEDRVAVLVTRSVEAVAAFLGVLRAGAAYVPLDPEYPDERLAFMAADAGVRAVLTVRELVDRARRVAPDGTPTVALVAEELLGDPAEGEAELESTSVGEHPGWAFRAAYVIYTSGTTGRPKGVVVSHGALANHAAAVATAYDLGPEDRVLQFASVSFDIAGEEIYPSLAQGATLVLRTPELSLEPRALARFVADRGLTVVNIPTPLWHEWCRELDGPGDEVLPPVGLRLVVVGTEGALPERLRAWSTALRRAGRRTPRWVNAYGPTEATITATTHSAAPDTTAAEGAPVAVAHRVPIGRPITGLTAHVLDPRLEPVPLGATGELFLGGAGLARGYLGRPGATAAVFVPDPFAPDPFTSGPGRGARLYRTGDLARTRPDGALEFLGRGDDQVKIRGFRVELGEVESALAGHVAVREVAVLAVEAGPGDRRLAAYVVPEEGSAAPTAGVLREWLREWLATRLPVYMVPAAFVTLDALPLTPAGKVDRPRLPEPDLTVREGFHVAPRTPVEELLAEIWREVLGAERVGVHDDFFALGGHSLLATRVVSRVRDRLGAEVPVRVVFEAPTVAEMATRLGTSTAGAGGGLRWPPALPPLRPLDRTEGHRQGASAGETAVRRGPLSFAQQRLWFLDRLEPGRAIYNVPAATRLETDGRPLDVRALAGALQAIVDRHGALRTTFEQPSSIGGEAGAAREPAQVVRPEVHAVFSHHDLTALPGAVGRAEAARLGAVEAAAPFDLERGPLVRFALVSLCAEGPEPGAGPQQAAGAEVVAAVQGEQRVEHRLLVTFHHTVADGWSIDVFLRELALFYDARRSAGDGRRGSAETVPELPVQYLDYAAWQREILQGETLDGLLAFWRETLADAPRVIDLPADRPRPAVPSYRGGRCYFRVGTEVADALAALGRGARSSRFMTLLAAWQVLLARMCGVDDLLVGTPVAGRGRSELEGLVGLFVNTLVIRGKVAGDAPFRRLLEEVRERLLDLFAHAELPFERLVEELRPDRSLAHNPLFQVMFSFQSTGLVGPAACATCAREDTTPSLRPVLLSNYNDTARVDLVLDLWEDRGGLTGYVEYAADLFDRTSAQRVAARYQTLLAAVARDPERPVLALPLLTEAERQQTVVEWNATGRPVGADATLHGMVRARVRATPEAEALVTGGDGGERLTYGELGRRVETLGRHLRGLGVGPETLVGLFVERSSWMVTSLLGVLEAGGAYVPLDPSFPAERLEYMVEAAGLGLLLTERTLVDRLPTGERRDGAPERTVLVLDDDWPAIEADAAGAGEAHSLPVVAPEQLAYVIFTSGSTGKPKGVQIPHRAAVNFLRSMAREPGFGPEDTLLALTTLSFDIALLELLLPLTVSGRVVVAGSDEVQAADELAARIEDVKPTVVQATPATWRMLLELPPDRARFLPPPAKGLCGGEAMPRDLAERLLERGIELWNVYGPTETTVWSGALRVEPAVGPVPVGGPVDNTTLHVIEPLDPAGGVAPVGVSGELAIGGLGVARGYLGRPAMTAERFRPDSVFAAHSGAGGRVYRTGDLVRRRPDGTLEFLGRLDHQVKVRGYRIELGEIEAVLGRCPTVGQAAVVARDDRAGARLVAYVVAATGERPTVPVLRTTLERSLPGYMVPSVFVFLDALPLTPNGKVDRGALPAPGEDRPELAGGYVAPRTEVEEELVAIWRQVLRIERLGVTDNFFELGGHSLLATQVMTRVEETFGQDAPVRLLFEAPTVEALAERLVEGGLRAMDQEALERALDDIENLSEDELEALLG